METTHLCVILVCLPSLILGQPPSLTYHRPPRGCASLQCQPPSICEMRPLICQNPGPCTTGPLCVPPPDPCFGHTICPPGLRCQDILGNAECIPILSDPCSVAFCNVGTVCRNVNGRAVCLPASDPCTAITCYGSRCAVQNGIAVCIPEEEKPGYCPDLSSIGGCPAQCTADSGCFGNRKCCKNGCGYLCVRPVLNAPMPCGDRMCPPGTECQFQEVHCFRAPCPPFRKCIPTRPPSSGTKFCPRGLPTIDIQGNRYFCGRGPNRRSCHIGTYCNIHPTDLYAVCCPGKGPTNPRPKPGTCPQMRRPTVGICHVDCAVDWDCPMNLKCCSLGCGRACLAPVRIRPKHDPCRTTKCRRHQVCQLQQVYCIKAPCYPITTCVPRATAGPRGRCPFGYPVLNFGRKIMRCSPLSMCPDGTRCTRDGFCCWRSFGRRRLWSPNSSDDN